MTIVIVINDEWEYVCESYGANPCKGGCKCDTQILWNFYYDKNPDDLFNPLIPFIPFAFNATFKSQTVTIFRLYIYKNIIIYI